MFNKTKPTPPQSNTVPIPDDLPDLTQGRTGAPAATAAPAPRPAPQKTASLLSSDGLYADLYRRQFREPASVRGG